MGSYTVASGNFVGGAFGETVTAEQLEGCDIDALVQGGHLALIEVPDSSTAKSAKKEKE